MAAINVVYSQAKIVPDDSTMLNFRYHEMLFKTKANKFNKTLK